MTKILLFVYLMLVVGVLPQTVPLDVDFLQDMINKLKAITQLIGQSQDVSKQKPSTVQFNGISLYKQLPISFLKGQTYRIAGKVNNLNLFNIDSKKQILYIRVLFKNSTKNQHFSCRSILNKDNFQFQILCTIAKEGTFKVQFIIDDTASNFAQLDRQVVFKSEKKIDQSPPERPQNLRPQIIQNNFYIRWDQKCCLTTLTFKQRNKTKIFSLSGFDGSFKVPITEFYDWYQLQQFTVEATHSKSAYSTFAGLISNQSQKTSMNLLSCFHRYQYINNQKFQLLSPIPYKVSTNQTLYIKLRYKIPANSIIYNSNNLYKLDRMVMPVGLNSVVHPPNKDATYPINLVGDGPFTLQIYDTKGSIIMTRPVYVNFYPILPNMYDLNMIQLLSFQQAAQVYLMSKLGRPKAYVEAPSNMAPDSDKQDYIFRMLNQIRRVSIRKQLKKNQNLNQYAHKKLFNAILTKKLQTPIKDPSILQFGIGFRKETDIDQIYLICEGIFSVFICIQETLWSHRVIRSQWVSAGIGFFQVTNRLTVILIKFSPIDDASSSQSRNTLQNVLQAHKQSSVFRSPAGRQNLKQQAPSQKIIEVIKNATKIFERINPKILQNKEVTSYIKQWLFDQQLITLTRFLMKKGVKVKRQIIQDIILNDDWMITTTLYLVSNQPASDVKQVGYQFVYKDQNAIKIILVYI